ncbi:glycoside hydrolase family 9 protein [Ancylomarina sp. 16SWW S1-10-2]|uniref:glycoside hydrolase family 9 protein n=1 Tax=Ancylomarina sp. 16SWW S1-10-2 TaxID=2499681 RepID=UPI0012ADEA64|nr:glycoside hydrolase family 9 protein [Ancylomarina sp. 16SWW S1-10-2]MRT93973.1 cellulase [Ancylomarina sp. 16SWW S1-10-2]
MKINNYNIVAFLLLILFTAFTCTNKKMEKLVPTNEQLILINQVGYESNAPKKAMVRTNTDLFQIKNSIGEIIIEKAAGSKQYSSFSGDTVQTIDFSELTSKGEYYIVVNDSIISHKIRITDRPYTELVKSSLKSFYLNRSGMEIDSLYGGIWARPEGHPDTIVYFHSSAADKNHPENSMISSPKGWYDAGDYNKYIVNSSISTYTLLFAYDSFADYFNEENTNIPESNNDIPDILDEALYNLRWMMTMQDPFDGGVYHKLTTKNFEGFVMPNEAVNKRYVVQKSTAATLDFAATMAYASRLFANFSSTLPGLADSCLIQSEKAWKWALKNPKDFYVQNSDISTGPYDDTNLKDEWFWAASELYLATNDNVYSGFIADARLEINTPSWLNIGTLGVLSILSSNHKDEFSELQKRFLKYVDQKIEVENNSPYRISIDKYEWGSNSEFANQGMLKLFAYQLTKNTKYLNSARESLDYLLGRNATAYCFVTGFGSLSPMNIHHRPSAADSVQDPVSGFLVGGPNLIVPNDCGDEKVRSLFPAKAYADEQCSYSTNEIAINWNAPLVYLTSGIDAYGEKQ